MRLGAADDRHDAPPGTPHDPPRGRRRRALIGTALGLHGLGLVLTGLVIKATSVEGLPFTIPVPTLAAFTLLAVIAGIGAAIMPARRASRLNVLDALQYE